MYLKAVEINGFKSFGEKVYIEFNRGITAIVGPNGSGKSNILDAVLWVLGEQSYKNIRAKESQDVIFSGGKDKKPANKAEVSLIIENSDRYLDFDEDIVKITRRIHITGENEYLINDSKSKLKDIGALFLDTGIGKTAYSVIGQGKVERIINSSPKEIKNIIEEAAGIKKLQFNRIETQKNLANIEINLDKVEFILNETRENKNKIEKQAEIAEQYLNLKSELNSLSKGIATTELFVKENTFSELEVKISDKNKELTENQNDLNKTLDRLENIYTEKEDIKQEKERIDAKNRELKDFISNLEKEQAVAKTEISNYEKSKNVKEQEKISLNEKIKKLNEEKEEHTLNKEKIQKIIKDLEDENTLYDTEISKLEREEQEKKDLNENRNSKIRDLELDKQRANQDIENNEKNLKNYQSQIENSDIELEELNKKKEELNKKLENKNKDLEIKISEVAKIEERSDFLAEQLSELGRNINKISSVCQEFSYQEKNASGKLEALKRLDENNEGLFKGVKEVLAANISGVYGVLISLIDFDSKFEKAIEVAASGNLQDIVVENKEVAKKGIAILNEKKVGRASFLALDTIKVNKKNFNNTGISGVYGLASSIVRADNKYTDVIDFVFGNILIVENIDIATEILSKNQFWGNIVTLTGELLSSRGRITGGENQKSTINLIFERKKEIRELEEKVLNLKKEIEVNTQKREELAIKLEKYENEYDESDTLKENTENKRDILKVEIKDLELEFKNIEKDIHRTEFNKTEAERYKTDYTNKISSYSTSIEMFQNHIDTLVKERDEDDKALKEIIAKKEEFHKLYSEKRIIYLNNKDKLDQWDIQNNRLLERENEYYEENKKNERELSDCINSILELQDRETELASQIEEMNQKYNNENKDIEILTHKAKDLDDEERDLSRKKSSLETKVLHLDNEYKQLIEAKRKVDEEIENLKLKLEELIDIIEEKVEVENLKQKKDKLKNLEGKYNNFGSVNIDAIQEFKELKERYDFLATERDDIMKSKKQVLDLIQEIDERIHNDFYATYEQISENFYKMCDETLRNTEGRLNIINAEDFENCGIEIFVKFKNKKKQPLSLLSGGEKSMVAIAFIMAIFMYKPSPFTFLDEIEAALDEKNTRNLLAKLRDFTDKSQFILITHNKETMKESDSMFGVTMNKEIGISKIVSPDRIRKIMNEIKTE